MFTIATRFIFRTSLLTRHSKNNSSMMQTSITSFFKTKPPAKSDSPVQVAIDDGDHDDVSTAATKKSESEPEVNDSTAIDVKCPISNKRSLLDSDSDDEAVQKPRTSKRFALESPETSPAKPITPIKPKNEAQTITETGQKVSGDEKGSCGQVNKPEPVTPAKKVPFPLMQQSPLMNPDALIKKKISSGAFALHENIGHTWFRALQGEFDKPYFKKLSEFVKTQRDTKTVFPPDDKVYTWTRYHPIKDTRVVIIGQDPYHGPNQAHGLSFSVQKGVAVPKSLQNIFKELQNDIDNFKHPGHGDLTGWAKQGVLMLNACLTVNKGEPNSHQGKGWESFTDAVISWISKNASHNVVFILWGRFAQKKSTLIDKRHKILTSAHPSPFSADNGFFGCKHFSQTNAYLRSQKLREIDWTAL